MACSELSRYCIVALVSSFQNVPSNRNSSDNGDGRHSSAQESADFTIAAMRVHLRLFLSDSMASAKEYAIEEIVVGNSSFTFTINVDMALEQHIATIALAAK